MKPITIWLRYSDKRRFEFNHIEDGHAHVMRTHPKPISDVQKRSWPSALWVKTHAHLDSNNSVVYGA